MSEECDTNLRIPFSANALNFWYFQSEGKPEECDTGGSFAKRKSSLLESLQLCPFLNIRKANCMIQFSFASTKNSKTREWQNNVTWGQFCTICQNIYLLFPQQIICKDEMFNGLVKKQICYLLPTIVWTLEPSSGTPAASWRGPCSPAPWACPGRTPSVSSASPSSGRQGRRPIW